MKDLGVKSSTMKLGGIPVERRNRFIPLVPELDPYNVNACDVLRMTYINRLLNPRTAPDI